MTLSHDQIATAVRYYRSDETRDLTSVAEAIGSHGLNLWPPAAPMRSWRTPSTSAKRMSLRTRLRQVRVKSLAMSSSHANPTSRPDLRSRLGRRALLCTRFGESAGERLGWTAEGSDSTSLFINQPSS